MRLKIILFVLITFLLTNCISFKFKGKKSPKTYYSEFFIDNGVMQYFIKPLAYKNEKEKFTIDFTFRDTAQLYSDITTNYSIYSEKVIKNIDSAYFVCKNHKIYLQNCERLFVENKKLFHIRYSCKIKYSELVKLVYGEYKVHIFYNNSEHIFEPTKKAQNGLIVTKTHIIEIIEINRTN